MTAQPIPRVVFDTNTFLSALVFTTSRLAWLRSHWRQGGCVPLVSRESAKELIRVLAYPKLGLSAELSLELQSDYFPHCENVNPLERCPVLCRDLLVTGDEELLVLAGQTVFVIETPEEYRRRISGAERNL